MISMATQGGLGVTATRKLSHLIRLEKEDVVGRILHATRTIESDDGENNGKRFGPLNERQIIAVSYSVDQVT